VEWTVDYCIGVICYEVVLVLTNLSEMDGANGG